LARFFPVWLGFPGLAHFWLKFSGLAQFLLGLARFFVGFGSVRFILFFAYKTEPNRPVFSKI